MRKGRWTPTPKKCQSEGARLTFPNVLEWCCEDLHGNKVLAVQALTRLCCDCRDPLGQVVVPGLANFHLANVVLARFGVMAQNIKELILLVLAKFGHTTLHGGRGPRDRIPQFALPSVAHW